MVTQQVVGNRGEASKCTILMVVAVGVVAMTYNTCGEKNLTNWYNLLENYCI